MGIFPLDRPFFHASLRCTEERSDTRPQRQYGKGTALRHRAECRFHAPQSKTAPTGTANGLRRRSGSRCTASSPHRRRKGKNVLYKKGSRAGAYMAPVRLPAYIESPLCVIQHPYPIAVLQGACNCCSARGRLPVRHRTTPGLPPGTVSLPMRNAPPL